MTPTIDRLTVAKVVMHADDVAKRVHALDNPRDEDPNWRPTRENMPGWVPEMMAPFADYTPEAMFIFAVRLLAHFQTPGNAGSDERFKLTIFNAWCEHVPAYAGHIGRLHAYKDALPPDERFAYLGELRAMAGRP